MNHAAVTVQGWGHRSWRGLPRPESWVRGPIGEGNQDAPILVVVADANPFTHYLVEILEAEGLNEFTVADQSVVSAHLLKHHDVVVLGEVPLTDAQAEVIGHWVIAGGNLLAMRPDPRLATLMGLRDRRGTLDEGYLQVNASAHPWSGIVREPIQFHGPADLYEVEEAQVVATLYGPERFPTPNPAVTVRHVGSDGGHAAAFTYDLARSIVYTRQGNPAWRGVRGKQTRVRRSSDLFRHPDAAKEGSWAHWLDLANVGIPQADEQQRLLVNLIQHINRHRRPLPRFWYFPLGKKAMIVMTGDDHGHGGTIGRFDRYLDMDPREGAEEWSRVRSTSYVYPRIPMTDEQAHFYTQQGFEIALHVDTGCRDWRPSSLAFLFDRQMKDWRAAFPSLPLPSSGRTHCVAWSDWASQPKIERAHGIRLDVNYYHHPAEWAAGRPGFFTGSGIPMRFADTDGTVIDVYQAATQMTDESGQEYPETAEILLDRALGPEGFYGAFVANVHTDGDDSSISEAIVAAARARDVPVTSARRMVRWLDGRSRSKFEGVHLEGEALRFRIEVAEAAQGLVAMVPASWTAGSLERVTREGAPVDFHVETVKGMPYAFFPAESGRYTIDYHPEGREVQPHRTALTRRGGEDHLT